MSICNEIQQKIAELGSSDTIENKDELKHIEACQACQDYQQACEEMNHAMSGLGDFDAQEALVESTLNSILSLQEENKKPKSLLNNQWASALAASFMLVSLIALFPYNSISKFGLFSDTDVNSNQLETVSDEEKQKIKQRKEALSNKKQDNSGFEFVEVDVAQEVNRKQRRIPKKPAPPSSRRTIGGYSEPSAAMSVGLGRIETLEKIGTDGGLKSLRKEMMDELNEDTKRDFKNIASNQPVNSSQDQDSMPIVESFKDSNVTKLNAQVKGQAVKDGTVESPRAVIVQEQKAFTELVESEGDSLLMADSMDGEFETSKKSEQEIRELIDQRRKQIRDNAKVAKIKSKKVSASSRGVIDSERQRSDEQSESLDAITVTGSRINRTNNEEALIEGRVSNLGNILSPRLGLKAESSMALNPAKKFLAEMNSLNNITYQNATGYWANNYLPGDASMRLLAGNLLQNNGDINSIVKQNRQPFDYPSNSALAVYLSSDHANVNAQEPTRMRVQVGIQASNRKGGHRSAMNVVLVFNVTDYSSENAEKMKALLLALLKAKQASDNISVILTGVKGGELIKASEFRYGTIQTTMNRLVSEGIEQQGVSLSLHQAIKLASVNLQKDDDPTASLGSSVVMLVTDKSIEEISTIETTVHNNAVKGITFSTVSLATDNHQQLNQLALAGQGHARVLQNANDAKRVVEAELLASSRAVARALRLRIRLAKGVKLIKVLDSYNLNEKQAQRVRDAENSLDQRLSKNLGIQADRGEDEEGIQIVIPSFFAGDTHVVILDVLVSNPGAIADVSLRYKDLLYLRNAISRKQLNLSSDKKSLGPLQLNVLKNILSSRFALDIKQASDQLKSGNRDAALSSLLSLKKLYQSLRLEYPAWNNDAEIIKDEKLIQQYIELINQTTKSDAPQYNYIVDSLQYISWRKNITQSK